MQKIANKLGLEGLEESSYADGREYFKDLEARANLMAQLENKMGIASMSKRGGGGGGCSAFGGSSIPSQGTGEGYPWSGVGGSGSSGLCILVEYY